MSKTNGTTVAPEDIGLPEQGPEGFELRGNLSFARLNPAAGITARNTGQPQLCGWITGMAYAHVQGESTFGPFTRLIGEFFAVPFDRRREITATELFLPGVAERFICAALDKGVSAVPVRFEGWAYPDESGRKSRIGYVYKVFVRTPPGQLSVARRMAIECGIVQAPPAPPPQELEFDRGGFDLETGEVAQIAGGLSRIVNARGERTEAEAAIGAGAAE